MSNLKPLPTSITKSVLVSLYINQISEQEIIDEINIIFEKNERNKTKKTIPLFLFFKFIKIYGVPVGYTNQYLETELYKNS